MPLICLFSFSISDYRKTYLGSIWMHFSKSTSKRKKIREKENEFFFLFSCPRSTFREAYPNMPQVNMFNVIFETQMKLSKHVMYEGV